MSSLQTNIENVSENREIIMGLFHLELVLTCRAGYWHDLRITLFSYLNLILPFIIASLDFLTMKYRRFLFYLWCPFENMNKNLPITPTAKLMIFWMLNFF